MMWKKCAKRGMALVLTLAMALSALSMSAFAEGRAKVNYKMDKDGKTRIGIEGIVLDPYTFYDIGGDEKSPDVNSKFIKKKVLGGKMPGSSDTVQQHWAKVAARIFRGADECGSYDGTDSWEKNWGPNHKDSVWRVDVARRLGQVDGATWGEKRDDYVVLSGLTEFSAGNEKKLGGLDSVRHAMASQIAESYNRPQDEKKILAEPTGKDDSALPDLKGDKNDDGNWKQEGFYTILTSLEDAGSPRYFYDAFGIAFYDFDLAPITDENVQNITALEKYQDAEDPVKEAQDAGAAGVTYKKNENNGQPTIFHHENKSATTDNPSFSFEESITKSVSNSVTQSEEYSFSQHVGGEFGWEVTFPANIVNNVWKAHFGFSVDITTTEAFGKARTQEDGISKTETHTDTTNAEVPPHTERDVIKQPVKSSLEMGYDCPVVITYKVAIFSMHGKFTSATKADSTYDTAGYVHGYFSTIFGGDKEGPSAAENLYNRAIDNYGDNGYDKSHGTTDGSNHAVGGSYASMNQLNWKKITSGESKDDENYRKRLAKNAPMISSGAKMTISGTGYETTTTDPVPLYPLTDVVLDKGNKEGGYTLSKEERLNLDKFHVAGYDSHGTQKVPYYGFDPDNGYWELRDEGGKKLTDTKDIEIVTDNITKEQVVVAHNPGIYYLYWMMSDSANYTAKEGGRATNDTINTAKVKLTVKDDATVGLNNAKLTVNKKAKVVADDQPVELEHILNPVLVEKDGKKTYVPVQWNVKEMEGVTLDETGTADFDEPGIYHFQAVYQDYQSDWAEVTATEGRKLDKITFEEPEDDATEVEVTGEDDRVLQDNNHIKEKGHSIVVDLDTYLEFFDQYGQAWDGQKPKVTFSLPEGTEGAKLKGNTLTLTQAGTYQIQAAADGYEINPLTIRIDEWGEDQENQATDATDEQDAAPADDVDDIQDDAAAASADQTAETQDDGADSDAASSQE